MRTQVCDWYFVCVYVCVCVSVCVCVCVCVCVVFHVNALAVLKTLNSVHQFRALAALSLTAVNVGSGALLLLSTHTTHTSDCKFVCNMS